METQNLVNVTITSAIMADLAMFNSAISRAHI